MKKVKTNAPLSFLKKTSDHTTPKNKNSLLKIYLEFLANPKSIINSSESQFWIFPLIRGSIPDKA